MGANSNAPSAERVIDASGLRRPARGHRRPRPHERPGRHLQGGLPERDRGGGRGGCHHRLRHAEQHPTDTKDVEALRLKAKAAEEKAIVDYALYGLLTEGNAGEIAPIVDARGDRLQVLHGGDHGQRRRPRRRTRCARTSSLARRAGHEGLRARRGRHHRPKAHLQPSRRAAGSTRSRTTSLAPRRSKRRRCAGR